MKSNDSHSVKQPKQNDIFAIPNAAWPGENMLAELVSSMIPDKPAVQPQQQQPARATVESEVKTDYFKVLLSIATNAWRAKIEIPSGDVNRVSNHIEAIYRNLAEFGIVIQDFTGEAYNESQPMKVIASNPTPGVDTRRIKQTVLPSVYWNTRLLQSGEVELETPMPSSANP